MGTTAASAGTQGFQAHSSTFGQIGKGPKKYPLLRTIAKEDLMAFIMEIDNTNREHPGNVITANQTINLATAITIRTYVNGLQSRRSCGNPLITAMGQLPKFEDIFASHVLISNPVFKDNLIHLYNVAYYEESIASFYQEVKHPCPAITEKSVFGKWLGKFTTSMSFFLIDDSLLKQCVQTALQKYNNNLHLALTQSVHNPMITYEDFLQQIWAALEIPANLSSKGRQVHNDTDADDDSSTNRRIKRNHRLNRSQQNRPNNGNQTSHWNQRVRNNNNNNNNGNNNGYSSYRNNNNQTTEPKVKGVDQSTGKGDGGKAEHPKVVSDNKPRADQGNGSGNGTKRTFDGAPKKPNGGGGKGKN